MTEIKAIFYDFDGVIKESTQIKTEAFYTLYLPYGKEIAEKAKKHHIENGGISRFEKFKYYHKQFLNVDLDEDEINSLAKEFSKIVFQKVIECPYVKGAKESIVTLKTNYKQFIVTGTPQNEIEQILKSLKINHFFDGIFGSPKNKIEISKQILDTEKLNHNQVVFIGDATTDFKAAKHFKFKFILREHSENIHIFNAVNEPFIRTKDLTNIPQLIKKINT